MTVLLGFGAGAAIGGFAGFAAMLMWADFDNFAAITWPLTGAFLGAAAGAVIAG